ncbi:MAG: SAM-dependent methyltransferase, partial [Candidatus Marinimicrobia bacterium]|nr:SAM-dependent methyltransferase [Candidatus Neomarinimicrobiota bacterium]
MTKLNKRTIETYGDLPKWGLHFLKLVSSIKKGVITIITPEGKYLKYSGNTEGEEVILRINDWKFCEDLFLKGDIGLGESYVSGYWDCDNINKLIKLGVENYNELERVIKGSFLEIVFFRIKHMLNRNSKKGSRKNIYAHYDIGNDFFQLWLDPT